MLRSTALYFCLFMTLSATLNLTLWAQPARSIDKHSFWLNKTYPNQVFDGVMVGDSRLYRGFSPTRIEAKLPDVSLHNFGYSSARLTPDLLDAALGHLDPKSNTPFIVLAVTAHSLTAPTQGADNPHYDGLAQRNRATVWLSQRSEWIHGKAWPAWIDDPTDRLLMARQGADSVQYRETFDTRGFVASSTLPRDPKRALASYRELLKESPVQSQRLKALATWVQQKVATGVGVVAFVPPRTPAMQKLERETGGWSKHDIKDQLEAAGAHWIDLKWDGLSSYDGSHLDEESAEIVSKRLGVALGEVLKADRLNDR